MEYLKMELEKYQRYVNALNSLPDNLLKVLSDSPESLTAVAESVRISTTNSDCQP
jgi:hypothetical protein